MRSTLPLCRPVGAGSEALSSERPRTPASVFACAAPLPFVLLRSSAPSSSSSSFSSFSSTLRGRMRSSTARLLSALLAVRPCVHKCADADVVVFVSRQARVAEATGAHLNHAALFNSSICAC